MQHPEVLLPSWVPSASDFTPTRAQLVLSAISPGPSLSDGGDSNTREPSAWVTEKTVSRPGGQVPQLKQER